MLFRSNDVGSPDGRHTSGLKVHINAQVVRVEDLNWYYKLLQLCPHIHGELKSKVVSARFDDLPFMTKAAQSSPGRTDARPRHCGLISTCRVPATGARDGSAGTVVGSASTAGSAIGTVIPAGRMNASNLSIVT
jgi:hypothetical protein